VPWPSQSSRKKIVPHDLTVQELVNRIMPQGFVSSCLDTLLEQMIGNDEYVKDSLWPILDRCFTPNEIMDRLKVKERFANELYDWINKLESSNCPLLDPSSSSSSSLSATPAVTTRIESTPNSLQCTIPPVQTDKDLQARRELANDQKQLDNDNGMDYGDYEGSFSEEFSYEVIDIISQESVPDDALTRTTLAASHDKEQLFGTDGNPNTRKRGAARKNMKPAVGNKLVEKKRR
jgi:hypothetical protein